MFKIRPKNKTLLLASLNLRVRLALRVEGLTLLKVSLLLFLRDSVLPLERLISALKTKAQEKLEKVNLNSNELLHGFSRIPEIQGYEHF